MPAKVLVDLHKAESDDYVEGKSKRLGAGESRRVNARWQGRAEWGEADKKFVEKVWRGHDKGVHKVITSQGQEIPLRNNKNTERVLHYKKDLRLRTLPKELSLKRQVEHQLVITG